MKTKELRELKEIINLLENTSYPKEKLVEADCYGCCGCCSDYDNAIEELVIRLKQLIGE